MSDVLMSRPAHANPFGKCTEELKTRVPYQVKEAFTRIAHDLDMTEAELLREMVMVKVYGVDMVQKIYAERVSRVAGIGPLKGGDANG